MNRPKQVNFQLDDDLLEDIKTLAHRRNQTLSTFIRVTLEQELERESLTQVRFEDDA